MGAWSEMILKQSKDSVYSILCSSGSQWSIGVTGKIFLLKQVHMTKYKERHNEGKVVLVACRTRGQNVERDRMKEKSSWLPAEPDDNIQDRDRMKEKSSWLPAEPEDKIHREHMRENRPGYFQNQMTKYRTDQMKEKLSWLPAEPEDKIHRDQMRKNRPGYLQSKMTKYRTDQMKEKSSWLPAEPDDKMQRETGRRKNRPDCLQNQRKKYRDRMKTE